MKPKTVAQHLNDMPDGEAKDKALANADTRYSNDVCYTLGFALTFAVNYPNRADAQYWENFINELK